MGAHHKIRAYYPPERKGKKETGEKLTEQEKIEWVKQQFRIDQDDDEAYYGHREGYSGAFNSVSVPYRFMDRQFTGRKIQEGDPYTRLHGGRKKLTGQEEAYAFAFDKVPKGDSIAVSFMYSPGHRKRKRKGWLVVALCPS